MFYLYVLKSYIVERHYIGTTADIDRRLDQHNQSRVRSTKAYRPWQLVYSEKFSNKTNARKREIELKKHAWKRNELFNNLKTK